MFFPVTLPVDITMNTGFFSMFEWTTYLTPQGVNVEYACFWNNGTVEYMASDCLYNQGVYTAMAPEYNTITAGDWTILITSRFNRIKDGLEFT